MDTIDVAPTDLVAEYIKLRDMRDNAKDHFKEWLRTNCLDRMEALELQLLDALNKLKAQSISSDVGTVYRLPVVSVTIQDAREFRRHVIGEEDWDLLDWRANKTRVKNLVETGEPVPPGLKYTPSFTVGIRKA